MLPKGGDVVALIGKSVSWDCWWSYRRETWHGGGRCMGICCLARNRKTSRYFRGAERDTNEGHMTRRSHRVVDTRRILERRPE